MENKQTVLTCGLLVLFCVLGVVAVTTSGIMPSVETSSGGVLYEASVCPTVLRANGDVEVLECNHNVVYNTGLELIEGVIGGAVAKDASDVIALCNATLGCGTPVIAASETFSEITTCGLAKATGTYGSLGTGNWSIYNTFTSTCDNVVINTSRLMNDIPTNFAGNVFSSSVTLQNADQLTVNWTIYVTDA